jgi:inosine-uridine nucleoside N-ribohydrolase
MHGSVRLGYGGSQKVSAEYNVRADADACQQVLSAEWPITITPLDTCGIVQLDGAPYRQVFRSTDPVAKAIVENYRIWQSRRDNPDAWKTRSSTLFDTVAVYLGYADSLLTLERLGIRVTNDGFTRIDPVAKRMSVATAWKDLPAFRQLLADRLTGPTVLPPR